MEEIFHFKKKIDSQNTSINFFNPIECQGNVHPTIPSIILYLTKCLLQFQLQFISSITQQDNFKSVLVSKVTSIHPPGKLIKNIARIPRK